MPGHVMSVSLVVGSMTQKTTDWSFRSRITFFNIVRLFERFPRKDSWILMKIIRRIKGTDDV